jgi:hypothetical protein
MLSVKTLLDTLTSDVIYNVQNLEAIFNPDVNFVGTWDCIHSTKDFVRIAVYASNF